MVVLMPLMFALMFTGMQAALIYHARTVAVAAAQEGARAAAARNGTIGQGRSAAAGFVASAGGDGVLQAVQVAVSRAANTATVTVIGQSLSVVPGWVPQITQSATLPVERLT